MFLIIIKNNNQDRFNEEIFFWKSDAVWLQWHIKDKARYVIWKLGSNYNDGYPVFNRIFHQLLLEPNRNIIDEPIKNFRNTGFKR